MNRNLRLKHINLSGYRGLEDVSVDLRELNVLIGPNGSGKSTFLDSLSLLAEATRGDHGLPKAVANRGGINSLLSATGAEKLLISIVTDEFSAWEEEPIPSLRYGLELDDDRGVASIVREDLVEAEGAAAKKPPLLHRSLERMSVGGEEVSASEFRQRRHELAVGWCGHLPSAPYQMEAFASGLEKTARYVPIAVAPRSPIRLPQTLLPAQSFPAPSGEDLLSVLQKLRVDHEPWYQQIIDVLSVAFPGFKKLDYTVVGAGQIALAWFIDSLSRPLYSNELSDGTLRFLFLTTVLLSPDPPPIVLIDEPEVSMHPELLRLLAELLIQAADHCQLIVSTQSESLIRWLKPEHVIVVDREDGPTKLTRADQLDLGDWMHKYTMDELWRMNEIGGRR